MIRIREEVAQALSSGKPVVALESTLITHGLPRPVNLETALAAEEAVRGQDAMPATIAVLAGQPVVGMTRAEIEGLAASENAIKASRRDLAAAIVQKRTASTTVAATMALAHQAGICLFATGGIGGVHRGAEHSFDISADLMELSRTPMAVVCAGAKSILDIPKTLELLESLGVPVVGFGVDEFPAFYVGSSGRPVSVRIDDEAQIADFLKLHWSMGGAGVVVVQPASRPMSEYEFETALIEAERRAGSVSGAAVTPALLARLAEVTGGRTLAINRDLVVANASLAARIARQLAYTP